MPTKKLLISFTKGNTRPLDACGFVAQQVVKLHQAMAWAELQNSAAGRSSKIDQDASFHPTTGDRLGGLGEVLDPAWTCWQRDAGTLALWSTVLLFFPCGPAARNYCAVGVWRTAGNPTTMLHPQYRIDVFANTIGNSEGIKRNAMATYNVHNAHRWQTAANGNVYCVRAEPFENRARSASKAPTVSWWVPLNSTASVKCVLLTSSQTTSVSGRVHIDCDWRV